MHDIKQEKGYRHILAAQAGFVHPGNGNVYFTVLGRDTLSVYRFFPDKGRSILVDAWHHRYGSSVPEAGVVIGMSGAMYVATSVITNGSVYDGSFITVPDVDEPWAPGDNGNDPALRHRIDTLGRTVAGLVRYLSATL